MITTKNVKETVQQLKIKHWSPRCCSLCNAPLYYIFEGDFVHFDSNCDCVPDYSYPVPRTYDDVAKLFNMQPDETIKKIMWEDFKTNSIKSEG